MSQRFDRVLVANRGEIAVRIIRACHELGLEAVAVHSDADAHAPHVRFADRAVQIGGAAATESYLRIDRLLEAAAQTGCGAVHPGYGFLAERSEFAQAVETAGLIFVGPPSGAIAAMGEKTGARQRMQAAGVPIVPGTTEPVADAAAAGEVAGQLGYPVLLKAVAGGGGKGMRVVHDASALDSSFAQAVSEATKAFGDGAIYVEKFVVRPRHVEIQVLADEHGRVVSVGERECSIQRRHQKLIEEAPSPAVTPDLRRAMGEAACAAAAAVDYRGAGTVEFLLAADGSFYFLEMNTRIQVEHPVTELVYGVDLVQQQLRIAQGEPIGLPVGELTPRGHAIECRITAEDPLSGFLPATGTITYLRVPTGPGVRWDSGVEVGSTVSLHYDPLVAKLIVWGADRPRAIQRMRRALRELVVAGVATSQPFHLAVMAEPDYQAGEVDIAYYDRVGVELLAQLPGPEDVRAAAIAAALLTDRERQRPSADVGMSPARSQSPWAVAARLEGLR